MHHRITLALILVLGLAASLPAAPARPQPLTLKPGEHICIIGNTLAERMQHDGYLETLLHSRFPQHELVMRNLGYSADEITTRLRSANFGSPDEWLAGKGNPIGGYEHNRFEHTATQADVIFAFFGYNEAQAGQAGLAQFRADLDKWIKHTLAQKYNGRTAPRLVLFSPIAHENLGDPNLPDGTENNKRLKLYTDAMAEVAAENGVLFVDLFTPTLAPRKGDKHWTINGIHLNAHGNEQVARIIDSALFGPFQHDPSRVAAIREAVLDKTFHWFNRYRVTDGYSTYGDRAFLIFHKSSSRNVKSDKDLSAEGLLPSNYDVMQRELEVLDRMTANRERHVWAVAQGKSSKVDDSKLPPFISAGTNKPGEGPNGEHLFLSGEAAAQRMKLAPNLKVQLFASEEMFPELVNPVQMAFDTKGRLWVAVWQSYPHWQPRSQMADKLLILEDTNGDGRADVCKTFAGDLHNPTGFEFYNGGLFVSQGSDILFLKDTDGDDRYDVKQRILHGFDTADTHHTANSFTLDPGGALYFQEGTFHHTQVETPWGPPIRNANGGVYRFEPRTWKLSAYVSYPFANPHGHVFNRWGTDIIIDGTGAQPYYGPSFSGHVNYPDKHTKPAPVVYKQRTRPCPAAEVLTSRHFPEEFQGNLLVQNVIGFQGILRYRLDETGSGLNGVELEPIVQSDDPNFRPVDIEIGPDGAIYFTDWQNPVIGHMQHNLRDESRDKTHGRVYRITYAGRPLNEPVKIAGEPVAKLLDLLKSDANRVRYQAKIELGARPTPGVMSALGEWVDALDKNDQGYQHHLMEALWLHQWHNVINESLLRQMLESPDHHARAAATRVLCYWRDRVSQPLDLLRARVNDEHPRVRLEAVRACSFFEDAAAADVALEALKAPMDEYLQYTFNETMRTLEPYWKRAIAEGRTIAANNPAGVDYLLRSVTTAELAKLPRTPLVYQALLARPQVVPAVREEALAGLAKANGTNVTTELLNAIERLDQDGGKQSAAALADLGQMLVSAKPQAADVDFRGRIRDIAATAKQPITRQVAYVALISADGSIDATWQQASGDAGTLADLLAAVPLIPDAKLRAAAHPRIVPLIEGKSVPVRRAAVEAIVSTGVDQAATVTSLAKLLDDDKMRSTAVRSLSRLPRTAWSPDAARQVVTAISEHVGNLKAADRTTPAIQQELQLAGEAAAVLPAGESSAAMKQLRGLGVPIIVLRPIPHQMLFDRNRFAVEAGKPVQLVFDNTDLMPHNVVILKSIPGALEKVGMAADAMAADPKAFELQFVPRLDEVLFATNLVQPQQRDRIDFTAPSQPGEYPFVCTFPGHWRRMYGVMVVVKDLEKWESKPTTPTDPLTGQPLQPVQASPAAPQHQH